MEHTILVAFTVEADKREDAERALMDMLPNPEDTAHAKAGLISWWVAEDDRHDRSDNDSAVFCDRGTQERASRLLNANALTGRWNIVKRRNSVTL